MDDTSEAPEDEEVVEKPPPPPPPEEESDSSADVIPMPSNGRCPLDWLGVYSMYIDNYCFPLPEDFFMSSVCPEGFTFTQWNVCQDVDRYISCADDTVSDAWSQCYDPAIWGECPDGMALDFLGYCQGYSHDGECPQGFVLGYYNYCQNPARNDYCLIGDHVLDPWGVCYDSSHDAGQSG
ncbi:hypothetical protein [Candidatus Poriferisocius sp.]|uniref:hypothetical protein n=1 Tax=Candidatus Poriferisocius sp. TaxID=3101276 RepID=UPI003B516BB0